MHSKTNTALHSGRGGGRGKGPRTGRGDLVRHVREDFVEFRDPTTIERAASADLVVVQRRILDDAKTREVSAIALT